MSAHSPDLLPVCTGHDSALEGTPKAVPGEQSGTWVLDLSEMRCPGDPDAGCRRWWWTRTKP